MHAYVHTAMHTQSYNDLYIHTYMHAYIHTYMHTHTHLDGYIRTCTHIHACMHACMCIHTYMHACMHACIRAHTCMHAHVRIQTNTLVEEGCKTLWCSPITEESGQLHTQRGNKSCASDTMAMRQAYHRAFFASDVLKQSLNDFSRCFWTESSMPRCSRRISLLRGP